MAAPSSTTSISVPTSPAVANEIQSIFDKNKLGDLKEFMGRRKCLNTCNISLVYLFHIFQSAGIMTTSVAAGYDIKMLVWIGIGLNITATLIHVFEKTNTSISKQLLKDIHTIQQGTYVDESSLQIETNETKEVKDTAASAETTALSATGVSATDKSEPLLERDEKE
jgi:hypothetical protein